jgi:hypothetical protein
MSNDEIEKYISDNVTWDNLPHSTQASLIREDFVYKIGKYEKGFIWGFYLFFSLIKEVVDYNFLSKAFIYK